jgi:hypothetical protein
MVGDRPGTCVLLRKSDCKRGLLMKNEPTLENGQKTKLVGENSSQSATTLALSVVEDMEKNQVPDSLRQKVDGSLLGTCIVFLATMLGVQQQQIDTPLTIALVAFAVAIPILVYGFLYASYKVSPTLRGWRIVTAIFTGAWIAEGVGSLAVIIGVYCVILHLSLVAFKALLAMSILVTLLPFISVVILIAYYTMVEIRRRKQQVAISEEESLPRYQTYSSISVETIVELLQWCILSRSRAANGTLSDTSSARHRELYEFCCENQKMCVPITPSQLGRYVAFGYR